MQKKFIPIFLLSCASMGFFTYSILIPDFTSVPESISYFLLLVSTTNATWSSLVIWGKPKW